MARFGLDAGHVRDDQPDRRRQLHPPATGRTVAVARHPGQLRRAAGHGQPLRSRRAGPLRQRSGREGRTGGHVRPRRGRQGGVPRAGRGAAAHGAGSARSVPELRPAVRRLPRPAAPAPAALLLHLLLTGGDRHLPPDGRRAPWAGAQRRGRVLRGRVRSPGGRHGGQHGVHLRAQAHHPVPATGEPARPDDHGRRRHRDGPLPRLPAGAGRPQAAGRADRGVDPVLRLPGLRDRLPVRR